MCINGWWTWLENSQTLDHSLVMMRWNLSILFVLQIQIVLYFMAKVIRNKFCYRLKMFMFGNFQINEEFFCHKQWSIFVFKMFQCLSDVFSIYLIGVAHWDPTTVFTIKRDTMQYMGEALHRETARIFGDIQKERMWGWADTILKPLTPPTISHPSLVMSPNKMMW